MRVPVFDATGKRTSEILEFDENIFGDRIREVVLKEAILMYEARLRVGTHATKTRKDVSGTGRKLWKQKGTGRARTGPSRPPHWKGGGVVFILILAIILIQCLKRQEGLQWTVLGWQNSKTKKLCLERYQWMLQNKNYLWCIVQHGNQQSKSTCWLNTEDFNFLRSFLTFPVYPWKIRTFKSLSSFS